MMYSRGKGVPRDFVQGCMWFNLAASSGDSHYVSVRDTLQGAMPPQELAAVERLTREWREEHER